jgi:hypothetical protein
MLHPPQLSVERHTEIFCCVGIWDLCAIDVHWSLCNRLICKVDMYRFGFVEFNSQFLGQIAILFRAVSNFLVEFSLDSPTAMTAVSANVAVVLYSVVGKL